ncbi:MAG: MFS transporter [Bacillota bacterium]
MNSKKIIVTVASAAIQMCCGIAYVWSLFQNGIAEILFAGDSAKAALAYSLLLATLAFGSIIGGKLSSKYQTKYIVMFGGALAGLGFICSGLVTANFPYLIWFTYGIMGGIGMGMAYTPTIANAQRWYPDNKGLITGIIVASLGLGGVVFTPVISAMLTAFGGSGVGDSKTFLVLGAIVFVVTVACSFFLYESPKVATSATKTADNSKTVSEALRDPKLYLLALAFALSSMGGLMMIGFATSIATFKGMAEAASVGVIIISLFNSLGRLTWGAICDKIGRKNTLFILMIGSAVSTALVILANGWWIFALIAIIGFFYGGLLSTFPNATSDLFGQKNVATIYGMVMIGFGCGAVMSSTIAGIFKDKATISGNFNDMIPAFIIAACAALAALGIIAIISFPKKTAAKIAETKIKATTAEDAE